MEEDDTGCAVRDSDVKPAINAALFPLVHGQMTIEEFEALACTVYDLVMSSRRETAERARGPVDACEPEGAR